MRKIIVRTPMPTGDEVAAITGITNKERKAVEAYAQGVLARWAAGDRGKTRLAKGAKRRAKKAA